VSAVVQQREALSRRQLPARTVRPLPRTAAPNDRRPEFADRLARLRGRQQVVLPAVQAPLAFQRWVPGVGRDVGVVASFTESTFYGDYELGFPRPGFWREVLNSDYFDTFPNPTVQGNGGGITAAGPPRHDLPTSARITIPANGILDFATDPGDPEAP
jgi:1,4-alpha-glucan branching enzyme